MDKYEIATLADDYHTKKLRFDCLNQQNSYGLDPEIGRRLTIEYHIAEAELLEAHSRLERAKRGLASMPWGG